MASLWRGQYYRYRELSLNLLTIYRQRSDLQAFLEIILSLVTLIVFTVFALKPTALTMINLTKEIKEKKDTLASLNQKINDLQVANSLFIENQSLVPIIDSSIANFPQPDTLSKQVLALAQKNSIEILGISVSQLSIVGPGEAKKDTAEVKALPEGALPMEISVNVKGEYKNLLTFLKDAEAMRIPIKFDTLTISNSSENTGIGITQFVVGRVPYLGGQN